MAASSVSLKLLIDTDGNKVLFAEAGKDFVDFLLHLLTLPIGTVTKLLTKNDMVGSLGSLYKSIEDLSETYMLGSGSKNAILNPSFASYAINAPFLLSNDAEPSTRKVYMCSYNHGQIMVSDNPNARCPSCNNMMNVGAVFVNSGASANTDQTSKNDDEVGFVRGVITYMIMDNLEVKPMSTISSITLLNKFNVKDVGALEEKVVSIGMEEGLNILKASIQSNTVLTSVFLAK